MTDKIYLGTFRETSEPLYLEKHSWDCGWYWGFGYVGNSKMHTHFNRLFLHDCKTADELFIEPQFSNHSWWIIRDLSITAYALKEAAAVYKYGGHQTTTEETQKHTSPKMVKQINKDLEKVLDRLWTFMQEKHGELHS